MTTEIINAIISFAGVVISSLLSWCISRFTLKKEIEKMKLTWEREDVVSSDEEFAEMASAVAKYIACRDAQSQTDALARIAIVRTKETEDVSTYLDLLFRAVRTKNLTGANAFLTEVLDEKREQKSQSKATKVHKPKK